MKLLLFALLGLACVAARAQELSASDTAALIARIAAAKRQTAIQADFSEDRQIAFMKKPVHETGTVAFQPPNSFRRQVDGGSLTVCDGQTLWIYYPQFQQVEKYSLSSNRALRESLSAMLSGFGLQDLEKNFTIRAASIPGGYRIDLLPRNSALRKTVASIQVDLSASLSARQLTVQGADGDKTITTFSNERPTSLSSKDFQFHPPAGVSVTEPMG